MQKKVREVPNGKRLSEKQLEKLNVIHGDKDPTTMLMVYELRQSTICLMALLPFSNLPPVVSAAAGDLDPSFDGDGKVTTDFSEPALRLGD
jgi:hypothetical protein